MASIAFLGDIHGDPRVLVAATQRAKAAGATVLIQVGDLGWSERFLKSLAEGAQNGYPLELPVFAIDGNHEDYGWLRDLPRQDGKVVSFQSAPDSPNRLVYVPRGTVLTLDGLRIGFLGGAESVDKKWRARGSQHPEIGAGAWWEEERVSLRDVAMLISNAGDEPLDVLVTHAPPNGVIRKHFPEDGLRMFDINPATWEDLSALRVQSAWERLGKPPLVCGHMHRHVEDGPVTILDINEIMLVPIGEVAVDK